MSKAKDLLETVKYMIIESGFDTVPQSLLKKAIDTALLELEAQSKECDGCVFFDEDQWGADCEECSVRFKNMFKLKDNA